MMTGVILVSSRLRSFCALACSLSVTSHVMAAVPVVVVVVVVV